MQTTPVVHNIRSRGPLPTVTGHTWWIGCENYLDGLTCVMPPDSYVCIRMIQTCFVDHDIFWWIAFVQLVVSNVNWPNLEVMRLLQFQRLRWLYNLKHASGTIDYRINSSGKSSVKWNTETNTNIIWYLQVLLKSEQETAHQMQVHQSTNWPGQQCPAQESATTSCSCVAGLVNCTQRRSIYDLFLYTI